MMVATQLNKSALFFGPAEQLLGASLAKSFISFAMRFCAAISVRGSKLRKRSNCSGKKRGKAAQGQLEMNVQRVRKGDQLREGNRHNPKAGTRVSAAVATRTERACGPATHCTPARPTRREQPLDSKSSATERVSFALRSLSWFCPLRRSCLFRDRRAALFARAAGFGRVAPS
jgi:hypothetical protein